MSDKEQTEVDRIVNRHKARLLTELEEARCPSVFVDAVKSKLNWLRDDLNAMNELKGTHETLQLPSVRQ